MWSLPKLIFVLAVIGPVAPYGFVTKGIVKDIIFIGCMEWSGMSNSEPGHPGGSLYIHSDPPPNSADPQNWSSTGTDLVNMEQRAEEIRERSRL
jgi:hypothetical protein